MWSDDRFVLATVSQLSEVLLSQEARSILLHTPQQALWSKRRYAAEERAHELKRRDKMEGVSQNEIKPGG